LEESERESWERGKELEKIRKIVGGCESFMNVVVYQKLREVLSGYEKRCTKKK